MPIKALLCGEGPTDYGKRDYNTGKWIEGPVQPLLRKSVALPLEIENVQKHEIRDLKFQRLYDGKRINSGHSVKALKLATLAEQRGKDCAFCYVDADKNSCESGADEHRCKQRFQEIYSDIQCGFAPMNGRVKGVAIIPLKMIESWLLADEQAFYRVFGHVPTTPVLPKRPEIVWGSDSDSGSNHPKQLLQRVIAQYPSHYDNFTDLFHDLANNSNITTLRQRCPISFGQFYDDMQQIT